MSIQVVLQWMRHIMRRYCVGPPLVTGQSANSFAVDEASDEARWWGRPDRGIVSDHRLWLSPGSVTWANACSSSTILLRRVSWSRAATDWDRYTLSTKSVSDERSEVVRGGRWDSVWSKTCSCKHKENIHIGKWLSFVHNIVSKTLEHTNVANFSPWLCPLQYCYAYTGKFPYDFINKKLTTKIWTFEYYDNMLREYNENKTAKICFLGLITKRKFPAIRYKWCYQYRIIIIAKIFRGLLFLQIKPNLIEVWLLLSECAWEREWYL